MKRTSLHHKAQEIFEAALRSVDAGLGVQHAVTLNDSLLKAGDTEIDISGRPIYLVAIGKASAAMTSGLTDVLGERITQGIVCGPHNQALHSQAWPTFIGGHPLPTEESILAARSVLRLLANAENNALIFFLISGGGSAMFELPINERITIDELREANLQLVSCGATIAEINTVRRTLGSKRWQARFCCLAADQITLIVSDTNPGDEANVASGPTIEPDVEPNAIEVVKRYALKESLPKSIMDAIARYVPEPRSTTARLRAHYVLLDNNTALQGAALKANEMGFVVEVAADINEQEISAGCDLLLARVQALWRRNEGKHCLISGGEFSCRVPGDGVGGRNLETVLRCALKMKEFSESPPWAILSAGTDSIDGNSFAAGATADETTTVRANSTGLDAPRFLARSDSFHFFEQLGDVIVSGPTGQSTRCARGSFGSAGVPFNVAKLTTTGSGSDRIQQM